MIRLFLLGLVHLYRWTLSPLLSVLGGPGAGCRFTPTCSEYALEALRVHGAGRGSWLAVRRLLQCHPWGGWGYDPVPPLTGHRYLSAAPTVELASPSSPGQASSSSPH